MANVFPRFIIAVLCNEVKVEHRLSPRSLQAHPHHQVGLYCHLNTQATLVSVRFGRDQHVLGGIVVYGKKILAS